MTGDDVVKLLWTVKATWPTFQVLEGDLLAAQVQAWGGLLGEFDYPTAAAAVAVLAAHGREFAPAPGQLRQALLAAAGALAPDVDGALSEVHQQIRRVGYLGSPEWSHPAIAATVQALGGWAEVCASTNPEAFRAHFRQLYAPAAARENHDVLTPPAHRAALGAGSRLALEAGT